MDLWGKVQVIQLVSVEHDQWKWYAQQICDHIDNVGTRTIGQLIWRTYRIISLTLKLASKSGPNSSLSSNQMPQFQLILELVLKRVSNSYFTAQMLSAQKWREEKSRRNSIDLTPFRWPISCLITLQDFFLIFVTLLNILIEFSKRHCFKHCKNCKT